MKKNNSAAVFCQILVILLFSFVAVFPQTTEFSYQGFLNDANASANGNFDFEFRLHSAASGGSLEGTIQRLNVPVTNGVFSVTLDFGAGAFPGADRYLEIRVRPAGSGSLTTLSPRQRIGRTPYAINAQNSVNSTQLGGIAANQFVQTNDTRLTDARNPLPNSTNYVQNRTSQQTSTNFNVSGNGTVGGTLTGNIISATTQYNIGNNRVLAKIGINNLFLGTLAGSADGGIQNTMIGDSAGKLNTGNENAMFGFIAAQNSTTGSNNSIFGSRAGLNNTTGGDNAFFGKSSGDTNITGNRNTALGFNADVGATNLTNATAIGANAFVEQSNSLVLGSTNGVNGATNTTDVGIGITAPARRLDVNGIIRVGSTTGTNGCIENREGTVIAGVCSSDLRFKKNITPFGSVLNNFSKLRPVNYFWRSDEFTDQRFGTKQSYGLIAQEVEEIFPELVSTDEKGFKAINYSKLPLYTIQAVNELKAENDELKTKIRQQQILLEGLQKIVCQDNPQAEICK